jgi:hypothetical protein
VKNTNSFAVSARLIISGENFNTDMFREMLIKPEKVWKQGDLVIPQAKKLHSDNGVAFKLIKSCSEYEWLDLIEQKITEISADIIKFNLKQFNVKPELSLFIETDGSTFPPIHFKYSMILLMNNIGAELDIDIVCTIKN